MDIKSILKSKPKEIPPSILNTFITKARYAGFFDFDIKLMKRLYGYLYSKYFKIGVFLIVLGIVLSFFNIVFITLLVIGIILLLFINKLILLELDNLIKKRKIKYMFLAPFAASLIAMYLRLGYSMQRLVEELAKQNLDIFSQDLKRVLIAVRKGKSLAEAFLMYAAYVPDEQMRAILLELHREYLYGADRRTLAKAIISKGMEMRDRIVAEYKKIEGSLQMVLTFHMSLNVFPLFVIVVSATREAIGMLLPISIPIYAIFIAPVLQIAIILWSTSTLTI